MLPTWCYSRRSRSCSPCSRSILSAMHCAITSIRDRESKSVCKASVFSDPISWPDYLYSGSEVGGSSPVLLNGSRHLGWLLTLDRGLTAPCMDFACSVSSLLPRSRSMPKTRSPHKQVITYLVFLFLFS